MKEDWKDYYHKGLAVFLTVAMCILFFFVVFRFKEFSSYIGILAKILRPFVFGAVIAYLLSPLCSWFERRAAELLKLDKKTEDQQKRYGAWISALGIFFSLFLFCLVIYALIAMVVPQVISSILILIDAMPGYIQKTSDWIEKLVADNPVLLNYVEQYSEDIMVSAQDFTKSFLIPNINNIISGVSTSLVTMVMALKDLVIGVIVAVYLMGSRKIFRSQAKRVLHAVFLPKNGEEKSPKEQWILEEAKTLNDYLGGFIKGKLLDSLIIGLICMVFTTMVEMPYAMLVSVVIGVTNIIPFFGPFIGAIPSAILILMVNPIKCIYFILFILVLQQFDGNILGPKILGNTTKLSSFWVLFAILLFGGVFGIAGMVLGVPIFAFIYHLFKEWVERREKKEEEKKKKQEVKEE